MPLLSHPWLTNISTEPHLSLPFTLATCIGQIYWSHTVGPQTLATHFGHLVVHPYRPHTSAIYSRATDIDHAHWSHLSTTYSWVTYISHIYRPHTLTAFFFGPGSDHIHQPHHQKILLPPSCHTTHRPHSSRTSLSSEFHTVWVLSSEFHTLLHTVWVLSSIHSESQTFSAPYIPSSRLSESWVPSSRLSNFRVRCSLHSELWVPYIPSARIRANFNIGFTHSWITFVPYRHWPHVCFTLQHNTAH